MEIIADKVWTEIIRWVYALSGTVTPMHWRVLGIILMVYALQRVYRNA